MNMYLGQKENKKFNLMSEAVFSFNDIQKAKEKEPVNYKERNCRHRCYRMKRRSLLKGQLFS